MIPLDRRSLVVAALIVLLGLVVRAAVMLPLRRTPPNDPDLYLPLAKSLAEGRGYRIFGRPTAHRPPLYPIALAPGVALLGPMPTAWVVGLHLALGGATVALTGLAASRWGLPGRSSALAMLVVAVDPVLVAQSRGVMTETMAAALVSAVLASCASTPTIGSAVRTGVLGGLAALCRPNLLPLSGLIAVALFLGTPGRWPLRAARSFALLAALLVSLSPWAIRNLEVLGTPIWTTTHGGYTLWLANNHEYYDDVIRGSMAVWFGPDQTKWFEEARALAVGRPEYESDRIYRRLAVQVMLERPADFGRAMLERLGRFWSVSPSSAVYPGPLRLATAVWTIPLWGLLAAGLGRRSSWTWPRSAAVAALLALTAVHALYWTDSRMRAPVVPAIALIAGSALGGVGFWRHGRRADS